MVFFIFLISNIGGCLTPIGDPPLLMGFMRGIPFFWSLHLLPVLLFNAVILLTIFYFLDRRAYRRDIADGLKPDISKPGTEVHILGLHNLIFLVMIVAAVILSGTLPGMEAFRDAEGAVRGIRLFGEVTLTYPALIEKCGNPPEEPLYLGSYPRGCSTFYRHLYYHAAGTHDFKGKWRKSWFKQTF